MILIFEMSWTGITHVASNSDVTQIIALAWPGQKILFHGDPSHLAELQRDEVLAALPNVALVPIEVSPLWPGRPQIVAWRRMLQEFRTMRSALKQVPPGEACLIFLVSTTATGSFAAAWAAKLSGKRAAVQVCFHGNLNDAVGWRPRNPLTRAFDTRRAIEARHPVPVRFLVLEEGIRQTLARLVPASVTRTDVLPHPMIPAEASAVATATLGLPLRVGFVGLGTPAKGINAFLAMATRLRARHGDRVEFIHVGVMPDGADTTGLDALAHPPARVALARSDFTAMLAALHYVILPFRRGYYDLSASGALLDAVTWLKPIITTRVPLTEQFFQAYGDIGELCDDDAGMEAAIEATILQPDPPRYARQVDALLAARQQRSPKALAQVYRRSVVEGFPGHFDQVGRVSAD